MSKSPHISDLHHITYKVYNGPGNFCCHSNQFNFSDVTMKTLYN